MAITSEQQPLLLSDDHRHAHTPSSMSTITVARNQTKRYLTSKYGHYSVLALVSVDISAIFADLILQLLTCEGRVPAKSGSVGSEVLGILSLVFSCLFMLELTASVWAFGWTYASPFLSPPLSPQLYCNHVSYSCLEVTSPLRSIVSTPPLSSPASFWT